MFSNRRDAMAPTGFYGWHVVGYASVALAATGPGQTVGVALFVDPLIAELGISRAAVSTAYLLGTLAGALALPWIGRAVDLYGIRRTMAVIGVVFGAVVASMGTLSTALVWGVFVSPGPSAFAFGVMLGAAGSIVRAVEAASLPRAFGTLHIGSIRGLVTAISVAGTAAGPLLFAAVADSSGTYAPALLGSALPPLLVGAWAVFAREPDLELLIGTHPADDGREPLTTLTAPRAPRS